MPDYLSTPYIKYEDLIIDSINYISNPKLLDLCCGDGVFSFIGTFYGAKVIAVDYSENSILIAKKRAKSLDINIDFIVSDVEKMPFKENSFDLVTCIGSISYLDHDLFLNEIYRVLNVGGAFICLDSYNHNIFYRLNRYLHFLKGHRSYSTLKRIPDKIFMNKINQKFRNVNIYYFGIFTFLSPILNLFFGKSKTAVLLNNLDKKLSIFKKYSFKIVFKANK